MNNKKLVIFDFDGVLANTLSFCFIIHKKNNPDFTWEKLREICMGNFNDEMKKEVDNNNHKVPDSFYDDYTNEISKIGIQNELRSLLEVLYDKYLIVIVSSTLIEPIKKFLIKEKIDHYFSDILGKEISFNKTLKINSCLEKYGVEAKDAIFITDTLGDIKEANDCHVSSIGVTWGLHDRETLERGNPIKILDNPKDLLKEIEDVLG